jgi:hypothetical protein
MITGGYWLVRDCLLCAGAGQRTHLHLGELVGVADLFAGHGAEPAEEEGQRDRDQAGLSSGNQWKSTDGPVIIDRLLPLASTLPDTTGENAISRIAEVRPP